MLRLRQKVLYSIHHTLSIGYLYQLLYFLRYRKVFLKLGKKNQLHFDWQLAIGNTCSRFCLSLRYKKESKILKLAHRDF